MATQLDIVEGPSKMDLMLALFDNFRGGREVFFHFVAKQSSAVCITGVKLEDGSRERFLFEGYTPAAKGGLSAPVNGCYDTKTRKGWIKFA